MKIENEQTHYRTRFELCPYTTTVPAIVEAFRCIYQWIYQKEQQHDDSKLFQNLRGKQMQARFLSGTFNYPDDYAGGLNLDEETHLATDALMGTHPTVPDAWALEYDEPDSRSSFLHWHTRIGLSTTDAGTCIVNFSVTYYTLPNYYGGKIKEPRPNIPRLVRNIIALPDYQCTVGETVIERAATKLDAETFADAFVDSLLSPDRELPLILILSNWEGEYSVGNVDLLASRLLGMANVYCADARDADLRAALFRLFPKDTPAYRYSCAHGTLRIYLPGICLNDAEGSRSHRFFKWNDVASYDSVDSFTEMLNRSLSRSYIKGNDDVVDLEVIEKLRNRREIAASNAKISELRQRIASAAKEHEEKLNYQELTFNQEQFDELKARLQAAEEEIETWKVYDETVMKLNHKLEDDNAALKREYDELAATAGNISQYKYQIDEANARAASWEKEARSLQANLASLRTLPGFISDVRDELELAEKLWSTRIVVLPEAYRSAKDFKAFDLEEEWKIISAVANELWDACFDSDDGGRLEDTFYHATGISLAMTESRTTRSDPQLMKLRDRQYGSKTIRCEPHVKGNGKGGRGDKFRLHFYVDRNNAKIVIGHCGEHLRTAGTSRM